MPNQLVTERRHDRRARSACARTGGCCRQCSLRHCSLRHCSPPPLPARPLLAPPALTSPVPPPALLAVCAPPWPVPARAGSSAPPALSAPPPAGNVGAPPLASGAVEAFPRLAAPTPITIEMSECFRGIPRSIEKTREMSQRMRAAGSKKTRRPSRPNGTFRRRRCDGHGADSRPCEGAVGRRRLRRSARARVTIKNYRGSPLFRQADGDCVPYLGGVGREHISRGLAMWPFPGSCSARWVVRAATRESVSPASAGSGGSAAGGAGERRYWQRRVSSQSPALGGALASGGARAAARRERRGRRSAGQRGSARRGGVERASALRAALALRVQRSTAS